MHHKDVVQLKQGGHSAHHITLTRWPQSHLITLTRWPHAHHITLTRWPHCSSHHPHKVATVLITLPSQGGYSAHHITLTRWPHAHQITLTRWPQCSSHHPHNHPPTSPSCDAHHLGYWCSPKSHVCIPSHVPLQGQPTPCQGKGEGKDKDGGRRGWREGEGEG